MNIEKLTKNISYRDLLNSLLDKLGISLTLQVQEKLLDHFYLDTSCANWKSKRKFNRSRVSSFEIFLLELLEHVLKEGVPSTWNFELENKEYYYLGSLKLQKFKFSFYELLDSTIIVSKKRF